MKNEKITYLASNKHCNKLTWNIQQDGGPLPSKAERKHMVVDEVDVSFSRIWLVPSLSGN